MFENQRILTVNKSIFKCGKDQKMIHYDNCLMKFLSYAASVFSFSFKHFFTFAVHSSKLDRNTHSLSIIKEETKNQGKGENESFVFTGERLPSNLE